MTAVDGAAAGATSAAVTGTSGTDDGAAAGATATAGAAGGASAGAVATAGWACVPLSAAGAAGGAPGTPPVTLIESSPDSSLLAGCGAATGGGAELAGTLRIESPTVFASGEPIGALLPSCANAADASAIATIAVATICAARLTLLRFFTIFFWRNFSLNLRMKLEHARLGMTAQSDPRHF